MSDPRTVAITGAGGDIGLAIARRFARDGCRLALLDRTEELAARHVTAIRAAGAADAAAFAADQLDRASIDKAFDSVVTQFGRVDVIAANAGFARFGSFLDISAKDWNLHVGVNLSGTFHACQSAARAMVESGGGGNIVVTASSLALEHTDMTGAYNASKAALLMLVRTMAAELGAHRIRANAVLPGAVETAMTAQMLSDPACREGLLAETPLGRIGRPEDVAEAVHFLASEQAGYITGASLLVDGGQSIYGQPRWYRQDRTTTPRWVPVFETEPT